MMYPRAKWLINDGLNNYWWHCIIIHWEQNNSTMENQIINEQDYGFTLKIQVEHLQTDPVNDSMG